MTIWQGSLLLSFFLREEKRNEYRPQKTSPRSSRTFRSRSSTTARDESVIFSRSQLKLVDIRCRPCRPVFAWLQTMNPKGLRFVSSHFVPRQIGNIPWYVHALRDLNNTEQKTREKAHGSQYSQTDQKWSEQLLHKHPHRHNTPTQMERTAKASITFFPQEITTISSHPSYTIRPCLPRPAMIGSAEAWRKRKISTTLTACSSALRTPTSLWMKTKAIRPPQNDSTPCH